MSVRLSYAFEKGNTNVTYTYDAGGSRASKTVNGTKSEFVYLDGKLVYEKRGGDDIFYLYDSYGSLSNIRWYKNGASSPTNIYVITNRQGDVLGLYDYAGTRKVSYEYDAWGNTVSVTDTSEDCWSTLNPFRYRGYYFDTETGLYYLLSRYYDPAVGRFLNADGYLSTGVGILGFNMFTYCNNSPLLFADPNGTKRLCALDDYINKDDSSDESDYDEFHPYYFMTSEHRTNTRPSNEEKHERGQARKNRDNGNEKGDKRRKDRSNKRRKNEIFEELPEPYIDYEYVSVGVAVVAVLYLVGNDLTGVGVADDFMILPLIEYIWDTVAA